VTTDNVVPIRRGAQLSTSGERLNPAGVIVTNWDPGHCPQCRTALDVERVGGITCGWCDHCTAVVQLGNELHLSGLPARRDLG
jgi:hypothetical protein